MKAKRLNIHTDIKYRPDGTAERDNNQVAGLPVVIYNIGATKWLHFQLMTYDGNNKANSGHPIPGHEFYFVQHDGHCLVLDARDEIPMLRGKTPQMSYWAHGSYLEDKKDDDAVAISFQFRFGNTNGLVNATTGKLQKWCQSSATDAKFDRAANVLEGEWYEKAKKAVYNALDNAFLK